jgi:hypothetical protein
MVINKVSRTIAEQIALLKKRWDVNERRANSGFLLGTYQLLSAEKLFGRICKPTKKITFSPPILILKVLSLVTILIVSLEMIIRDKNKGKWNREKMYYP